MKRWIKIGAWLLVIVLGVFFVFALWYQRTYSMDVVLSYEVNDTDSPQHILIATQGSVFKDSVLHELVREFKSRQMYVKVIDVSGLSEIKGEEWAAIIILHTWEYAKPPAPVKIFVNRMLNTNDKSKLIVLTTSGAGKYKMKGVDAITSASQLDDARTKAAEIITRVNKLLSAL